MGQGEGTREVPPQGSPLLWGEQPALSVRAGLLALQLFLVVAALQFVTLAALEEVVYLDFDPEFVHSALWEGLLDAFWHPALIGGLAAIHAYLNKGYLPAVLLASAPVFGMHIWVFSGPPTGPFVLTLEPLMGSWGWVPRVLRITLPWATAGFLLGLLARRVRARILTVTEAI